MIQREFYREREDGIKLYRTYSDAGYYIQKVKTNEVYTEAIDVENSQFTYEETTTPIEIEETEPEVVAEGQPTDTTEVTEDSDAGA